MKSAIHPPLGCTHTYTNPNKKKEIALEKHDPGIRSVDMGRFFEAFSCSRVRRHQEKVGGARFKMN